MTMASFVVSLTHMACRLLPFQNQPRDKNTFLLGWIADATQCKQYNAVISINTNISIIRKRQH